MRVTVLGKSPSWQDAAGACSGYLVTHDGFTLLLDCGNGVFAKLRAQMDYCDVDAVLISHLHADHFFDVVPYSFALSFGVRSAAPRPALHVPPGAIETLTTVGGCLGDPALVTRAFAVSEYDDSVALTLGPLRVSLCEVPHYLPTRAVRITAPDGRSFTFGADCRPNPALPSFAAGSDLLMLEATLTHQPEDPAARGHLTAREAGELAAAAGVQRLILTHFSDELDPARLAAEGTAGFGGEVALAHEGAGYDV